MYVCCVCFCDGLEWQSLVVEELLSRWEGTASFEAFVEWWTKVQSTLNVDT
jgi:hypothetical protein